MQLVKDYMMRTLNSVHPNDTIADVIRFMHKTEMTVFPVVNDENTFLGTIYTKNILKNIIPDHFSLIEVHRIFHDPDMAVENMRDLKDQKVKYFMSKNIEVVNESDTMDHIADIMKNNQEQYVFVVNEHKKLRGYISRADLLFYFLTLVEGRDRI